MNDDECGQSGEKVAAGGHVSGSDGADRRLWAAQGTAAVTIATPNQAAGGGVANVTPLASAASLVAQGNSQRVQGVALYEITDIAAG